MEITLRQYQQENYDCLFNYIRKNNHKKQIKVLDYLPTGGGKSILIAKTAHDLSGRTLILTNRIDILIQNSEWLKNYGTLTAKNDDVKKSHKVVISMVETLNSRIKNYGINYIGDFDNVIVDEAHILAFEKVYKEYEPKVLIGFTGTPVLNKHETKQIGDVKYRRRLTFSKYYDTLIETIDSQDLIDLGFLVQDYNIVLQNDTSKLKESSLNPDGYTVESLNDVFASTASIKILLEAYEKYGKGKKTILFNPTTRVNILTHSAFKNAGYNVKMYDTKTKGVKRNEIVEWYKNTKDAILINANVFTTGFNATDIECVIVNRATTSMSLWIQMVGRGSRISSNIFKDQFTVIDLGDNIYNHGVWSDRRKWIEYFYPEEWSIVKPLSIIKTWDCAVCEAINQINEFKCCNCSNTLENNRKLLSGGIKEFKTRTGELVAINRAIIPKANKIIKYAIKNGKDKSFVYNLAEKKIVDLFIQYKVSKEYYFKRQEDFKKRVKEIYLPIYFAAMNSKELKGGANRKLETMLNRLYAKINNLYNHEQDTIHTIKKAEKYV